MIKIFGAKFARRSKKIVSSSLEHGACRFRRETFGVSKHHLAKISDQAPYEEA